MKQSFTEKEKAIIKFILSNGNKPAYQKQISEGAGVSEQYLGPDEEGRLSVLVKRGILVSKVGKVHKRISNFFHLNEDFGTSKEIAIEFLKDKNSAAIFMNSTYAQKVIDCVAETESMLFEDEVGSEELKKMLRLSPKMFELCLTVDNLGGKFTSMSSKIDYYGAWDIALKKEQGTEKTSLILSEDLSDVLSDCEKEENKKYLATIKHHIRWGLFRFCLKTDFFFWGTGELTEEIEEILTGERIDRSLAAIFASASENGLNAEEIAEMMNNPDKHPEELKELAEKARAMDESRLANPERIKEC
jgi:hypothetical protein